MLVLARKNAETITINLAGQVITLTLLAGSNGRAKIGIDAPRAARVLRGELGEKKKGRAA